MSLMKILSDKDSRKWCHENRIQYQNMADASFCSEKQMIEATEDLYREAVNFYYELLKDWEDLWEENLLAIQGQLEN